MDKPEVEKLTEKALEPLSTFHNELFKLAYRRDNEYARERFEILLKFDKEIDETWDSLCKTYKVNNVYGLPENVYKSTCQKFAKKAREMIDESYRKSVISRDSKMAHLAFKLCLYHGYGFLTDGHLLGIERKICKNEMADAILGDKKDMECIV